MRRLNHLLRLGTPLWIGALLAGCATAPPEDYPATIASLDRALGDQGTAVAAARADQKALGDRLAAVQTTATSAFAITPTAPPTAVISTAGLTLTASLSATAPLSASLPLGSGDCGPLPEGAIDHEDAAGFIGSQATVQGRVVGVGRAKKAVFLNFHQPYAGYFSGVIFISAWKDFPGTFEDLYAGRCVRLSGQIKEYQGAPEIIISSPEQVEVLP